MQGTIRIATTTDFDAVLNLDRKATADSLDRSSQILQALNELHCYVMISGSDIQAFAIFARRTFRDMDFLDLLVEDPA